MPGFMWNHLIILSCMEDSSRAGTRLPAFLNENHLLSIVSYKDKIAGLQQIWLFTGSKLLDIGTKLGPIGTWPPTGKPQLSSRASVPGPSDGAGPLCIGGRKVGLSLQSHYISPIRNRDLYSSRLPTCPPT